MKRLFDSKCDIHIHSIFSDGVDSLDEIVQFYTNQNFCLIGISDHYEKIDKIDEYTESLKNLAIEYANKVKVLKGVELKASTLLSLNKDEICKLNHLDYVLIEDIEYLTSINDFIKKFERISENLNCLIGVAHLDMQRIIIQHGEKNILNILKFMEKNKCFFELNSNESNDFHNNLLYFDDEQTRYCKNLLRNFDISIIIGSDTHCISDYNMNRFLQADKLLSQLVIEKNDC